MRSVWKVIIAVVTIVVAQNTMADGPLRVRKMPRGFKITKMIEGREVLLAYSDSENYDEALANRPEFKRVIETFDAQKRIKGPRMTTDVTLPEAVEPLCTDIWNQYDPYNNFAPMIDGERCMTGCVPTAMAQAMYYYKYPEKGTGSHWYIDIAGSKDTLTADFDQHRYDWDYMLDTYSNIEFTQRQADAVALLHIDCGVAVEAKFGVGATSAASAKQPYALHKYFGYDKGMRMIERDFYRRNELHSLIKQELAAGHPVLCSGFGNDGGGHAFVIDGYDSNDLYHINWGWGGWCNGYYNIDYMNPDQPEWGHHPDRIENGANITQSYLLGVQPATHAIGTKERHEFAFSHMEILNHEGKNATVIVHNLQNVGWNRHEGKVGIGVKNAECEDAGEAGQLTCMVHEFSHDFKDIFADTAFVDTIEITMPDNIKEGTYRVMPVFEENGEWAEARTSCGTPNYIYYKKTQDGDSWTQPTGANEHLRLTDVQFPDTILRKKTLQFSISVKNESQQDYCGRIYVVYTTPADTTKLYALGYAGVYIESNEEKVIDYRYVYTNIPADQAKVMVVYDIDLFTDSLRIFDFMHQVVITDIPNAINEIMMDEDPYDSRGTYDLTGRAVKPENKKQIVITSKRKKVMM